MADELMILGMAEHESVCFLGVWVGKSEERSLTVWELHDLHGCDDRGARGI